MSEQVRDAGEVSFPVPHAAGREREGGDMVLPGTAHGFLYSPHPG